jgi:hypothetical protein
MLPERRACAQFYWGLLLAHRALRIRLVRRLSRRKERLRSFLLTTAGARFCRHSQLRSSHFPTGAAISYASADRNLFRLDNSVHSCVAYCQADRKIKVPVRESRPTTSRWGYVRADLPTTHGVAASRTDFVPRGVSGALVGLSLRTDSTRTITLRADAHSELLSSYPWGETKPSQTLVNLPDSARVQGKRLLFRDKGTPQSPNFTSHDWAAAFGSDLSPYATKTGKNFRGPQDPAVICPAPGPSAPPQLERCDDTEYGKGVGGQPAYKVKLRAGEVRTVWFGVGGSTSGPAQASAELHKALDNPEAAIGAVVRFRERVNALSEVSLPGNQLLAGSVAWSKQMLAASEQRVNDLQLRTVNAGQAYPPPAGTLKSMRWLGAGWPDYTWLFGTDGEYTAFAAVAAGQFGPIKDHLRALRDVSEIVNQGSGKIVHEVTPDGAVYFGANADPGNTDESSKYPSAVALVWRWTGDKRFLEDLYPASVKAMKYVSTLDEDGDGWPEGLGNVERAGMGEEKLDNAVYTIRGYADLADLAQPAGTSFGAAGLGRAWQHHAHPARTTVLHRQTGALPHRHRSDLGTRWQPWSEL